MLKIDGLCAGYGGIQVLGGVNVSVAPGEIVAILGPNGAGKSTLARSAAGLLMPTAGTVEIQGVDHSRSAPSKRVRAGLAMVPETRALFAGLSVFDNLELGGWTDKRSARDARVERVIELFPILGQRREQKAGSLSGGEQQMLAIGRALMSDPKFLILDEPSLGLAPMIIASIFKQLVELRQAGLGVMLIEQNATKALAIADRGVVVERGSVLMSGPAAELRADSRIVESYLGGGIAPKGPSSDA